jgi:hypothetical protein
MNGLEEIPFLRQLIVILIVMLLRISVPEFVLEQGANV